MRVAIKWLACVGLSAWAAAGCRSGTELPPDRRIQQGIDLADILRAEALRLPEKEEQREKLVSGLVQMREVLSQAPAPSEPPPVLPEPAGGPGPVPEWARMFAPKSILVSYFTQTKDFDHEPGDDGLEVYVQPLDQFGDPTKAVGTFRIEVFEHRPRTGEPRGVRRAHWVVQVLDAASNRRYYNPVRHAYVFPLQWASNIPAGTPIIVQVIFYPPGGFNEKLLAERQMKTGHAEDR